MLNEIDQIPDGFLQAEADQLFALLGKPTLIHLEGENPKPLFICTLLHGNETTGLYALQLLLKQYLDKPLPRSLSIFIGNVEAAAQKQRRLSTQNDYNRIWPGTQLSDSIETDIARSVTRIMRQYKPFASIDIHNNTGHNPHYGCVNILNPHGLQLASMFSNIAVYFTSPKGVQSAAFSDFCPAIVLECGQSGNQNGIIHVLDYLQTILALDNIPANHPHDLNLFHTLARVTIPGQVSFSTHTDKDIQILEILEQHNFDQLPAKTTFANIKSGISSAFIISNESNEDVTDEFLDYIDGKAILKKPVILSMYTTDQTAIRQDCLCYLMERLSLGRGRSE